MKKTTIVLIFSFAAINLSFAATEVQETQVPEQLHHTPFKDFVTTLKIMSKGMYLQFTTPATLVTAGVGALVLWPIFESDSKLLDKEEYPDPATRTVGYDITNTLNFGIVPLASYGISYFIKDKKLKNFAIESLAANGQVMIESLILSFIDIHERPQKGNLSKWETNFRSDSSWPSGHVAALTTLTFKTFQFYGFFPALLPAVGVYAGYKQRVGSRQHWPSDVIGTIFLAALASEGTRLANDDYHDSHPWHKFLFDHQFAMKPIYLDRGAGAVVSLNF